MKKSVKVIITLGVCFVAILVGALGSVVAFGTATPKTTIEAYNLTFKDTVYISYAVNFENAPANSEKGILVWETPQSSYTIETADCTKVTKVFTTETIDGKKCNVYNYSGIAAKELARDVYTVSFIKAPDGTYTYSEPHKYSVLQYAYNKLGYTGTATDDTGLVNLLNAMLDYGAEAQKYFNYDVENLANAKYYQILLSDGALADQSKRGLYREGIDITVTAPEVKDGKSFAGWMNGDGQYVSYDATYTFKMPAENTELTPVYAE